MFYQPDGRADHNTVTASPPSKVWRLLPFCFILLSALMSFQVSKSSNDREHQREKMELLCNLTRDFCQIITTLKFLLQNKINRKMPRFTREQTHRQIGMFSDFGSRTAPSSVPKGSKKVKSFGKSSRKRLRWKF